MNKQEIRERMPGYFNDAVGKVASVVNGEEVNLIFRPHWSTQTDWNIASEVYPEFADTIKSLGRAFERIKPLRIENPKTITRHFRYFENVSDPYASEFLAQILVARMCPTRGYLNSQINPAVESGNMSRELGLRNGWQGEDATQLTLRNVIGAVLTDTLKVSYQVQKHKRK